jgi:hypothetical protein
VRELIAALIADGHVEPVPGDVDRFRWIGEPAAWARRNHQPLMQGRVEESCW